MAKKVKKRNQDFNKEEKKYIKKRNNYKCNKCKKRMSKMEVDHIKAIMNGGKKNISNAQLLCEECHEEKTQEDLLVFNSRTKE